MSLYNSYILVLGLVMPLLVAVVLKRTWRKEVKTAIAAVTCTLCALALCYFQGKLQSEDILATVTQVNAISMLLFQNFWKPLGVANPLEGINLNLRFMRALVNLGGPGYPSTGPLTPLPPKRPKSPVASSPSDSEFYPPHDN